MIRVGLVGLRASQSRAGFEGSTVGCRFREEFGFRFRGRRMRASRR